MKVFITILLCLSVAFAQQPDSRCPPNEDSKTPTHFGHPTDCTKFFKCHNGQAHEINCPQGQHWNSEKNYCDTVMNAKCEVSAASFQNRPAVQHPLPPRRPAPPSRPNPQQPRPQPIAPPSIILPPQQITPPQRQPIIEHPDFLRCPWVDTPGQLVYFPYHLTCDHFYQCVNGRAILLRCPPGHSWDLRTDHCDRSEHVVCATPRRPLH